MQENIRKCKQIKEIQKKMSQDAKDLFGLKKRSQNARKCFKKCHKMSDKQENV